MIYDIADLLDDRADGLGEEVTVRCRIQSNRIPGTGGNVLKSIYVVDDPRQSIDERVALSFWSTNPLEEPLSSLISKTEDYVLDSLGLPMELEEGTGEPLRQGEEVLVRAIPNRSEGSEADLYLNVTSVAIREPSDLVSKSKLRTQDNCRRENYLRYVKNVYAGDRYSKPPYQQRAMLQGDAVHRITELAVEEHFDRFVDRAWDEERVESFCLEVLEREFGFRQALLVLSGAGLQVREYIVENVTNLFTDDGFVSTLVDADEVVAEEYLDEQYGYAGRVDLLLDGLPYDIKTTREPDKDRIQSHAFQVKLYLFAFILQSLDDGESLGDILEDEPAGALIYPNTSSGVVQIEPVELTTEDVAEFIELRNRAVSASAISAPPSPYNRDCEDCQFAVSEWITGEDDALPPACTYHCQNERRWPCYELVDGELQTDCSRFESCVQRLEYRDTTEIDYYNRKRRAFRAEKRARRTATQILDQFDTELLVTAGYRLPQLSCTGAEAAGTVLRFTSDRPVAPAFDPGATVGLRANDGSVSAQATYFGEREGAFLFKLESRGVTLPDVLGAEGGFDVTYQFNADAVDRKFLPYLDFAERRGITPGFEEAGTSDRKARTTDTIATVGESLDCETVFVDVPVHRHRSDRIAELVESVVTTPYPAPKNGDETVPEPAARALVLGTTPDLVQSAVDGQPVGEHYRLDGTGGDGSVIDEGDSYHEIQRRISEARSIVSSTQLAMSRSGPGDVPEFFHKLAEGDYKSADDLSRRDHSENFFDVLLLLGGGRLTEPEYHFLSDLADRVVVVGDTRRGGPSMLSSEATDAGLDQSYFKQAFDHYRSFPTDDTVSVQLAGEAPPALRLLYREGPWEPLDGRMEFLPIEGGEETAVDTVDLTTTVRAERAARRLVFDVTDTPVSPIEAQELFQERLSLDATLLTEGEITRIDGMSLFLREISDIDGEKTNSHEVVIRAEAAELSQFNRALLSNRVAERIVAQVARQGDIDIIVTPFEGHATEIERRLAEEGVDVPVRRPEALGGDIEETAVISFAVANDANIVRPPLDDPELLYELVTAAENLVLVGNEPTLSSKDFFDELLGSADPYEV
jgi:CRISPR/Cas system-associated exonuclease Cas4 (RecB family)